MLSTTEPALWSRSGLVVRPRSDATNAADSGTTLRLRAADRSVVALRLASSRSGRRGLIQTFVAAPPSPAADADADLWRDQGVGQVDAPPDVFATVAQVPAVCAAQPRDEVEAQAAVGRIPGVEPMPAAGGHVPGIRQMRLPVNRPDPFCYSSDRSMLGSLPLPSSRSRSMTGGSPSSAPRSST